MKSKWKWIIDMGILLLGSGLLLDWIPHKSQAIREIENLTGLQLPISSSLKFSEDDLWGRAFYILHVPEIQTFVSENKLKLKPYRNKGYLEQRTPNADFHPTDGDSLRTCSSHGLTNRWSAILGSESNLMWLTIHYMDPSGDPP